MNFKIISTLALAGACVFGTAHADTFDYSYLEAGVGDNIDNADEGVSLFFRGSYNILPSFNVYGEYSTTTSEGGQVLEESEDGSSATVVNEFDIDTDALTLGLGYHTAISDETDFTANVEYVSVEVSIANERGTDDPQVLAADSDNNLNGYGFGIGVRHKFTDELEGNANLDYVELDNEGATSLTLGGRYHFNEYISAGLSYTLGEGSDDDSATGSVRYGFGAE